MKKKEMTFANLKDIAKVFNVPEKRIVGWGILCKNDAPAAPCIIIKDSPAVIDLLAGKLITTGNIGWRNITAYPATRIKRSAKEINIHARTAPSECKDVVVEKAALYSIHRVRSFQDDVTYF